MRIAESPEAAETIYQHACAAGSEAAEMRLEELLMAEGRNNPLLDVDGLVRTVVDAALADAGRRLSTLMSAIDVPFPPGTPRHKAYCLGLFDASHLLGACPDHKALQLKLRYAGSN
jgi:hypothetical protein